MRGLCLCVLVTLLLVSAARGQCVFSTSTETGDVEDVNMVRGFRMQADQEIQVTSVAYDIGSLREGDNITIFCVLYYGEAYATLSYADTVILGPGVETRRTFELAQPPVVPQGISAFVGVVAASATRVFTTTVTTTAGCTGLVNDGGYTMSVLNPDDPVSNSPSPSSFGYDMSVQLMPTGTTLCPVGETGNVCNQFACTDECVCPPETSGAACDPTNTLSTCQVSGDSSSGHFLTNSVGQDYINNALCRATVGGPGLMTTVAVFGFHTESGFDFFKIYDGSSELHLYEGVAARPFFITLCDGYFDLEFSTDGSVIRSGVFLSWTTTSAPSDCANSIPTITSVNQFRSYGQISSASTSPPPPNPAPSTGSDSSMPWGLILAPVAVCLTIAIIWMVVHRHRARQREAALREARIAQRNVHLDDLEPPHAAAGPPVAPVAARPINPPASAPAPTPTSVQPWQAEQIDAPPAYDEVVGGL